jgi:hypothetical protein
MKVPSDVVAQEAIIFSGDPVANCVVYALCLSRFPVMTTFFDPPSIEQCTVLLEVLVTLLRRQM